MMDAKNLKFNMIVAGIGGQGINSLAKVLAEFLQHSGYYCQFTIHKGGAQSLGSVYAELRVCSLIDKVEPIVLGQGIPKGTLDILVALEPWEALRHILLAHQKTQLWVEIDAMPLFVERSHEYVIDSPKKQLNALPLAAIEWRSYRKMSLEKSGIAKMANYYAGLDCVSAIEALTGKVDFKLFDRLFFGLVKKAKAVNTL